MMPLMVKIFKKEKPFTIKRGAKYGKHEIKNLYRDDTGTITVIKCGCSGHNLYHPVIDGVVQWEQKAVIPLEVISQKGLRK